MSGRTHCDAGLRRDIRIGHMASPRLIIAAALAYCAMAWIDRVIRTSSPTRKPPVSSAAFHVRPKSLRLSVRLASKAARAFPQGSLATPRYVTGSMIFAATSRIVYVPTTPKVSSPVLTTCELVNVGVWRRAWQSWVTPSSCVSCSLTVVPSRFNRSVSVARSVLESRSSLSPSSWSGRPGTPAGNDHHGNRNRQLRGGVRREQPCRGHRQNGCATWSNKSSVRTRAGLNVFGLGPTAAILRPCRCAWTAADGRDHRRRAAALRPLIDLYRETGQRYGHSPDRLSSASMRSGTSPRRRTEPRTSSSQATPALSPMLERSAAGRP